ncbi:PilN domain-containing protein [bacterium]|nr:PilN domain-containing protein [bacterium]
MVEVIPKKKKKEESCLNKVLFLLFLVIFILGALITLFFNFQKKSYDNRTEKLSIDLYSLKESQEFEQLQKEAIIYQEKFYNIPKILAFYFQPSKLLTNVLEQAIYPGVVLRSFQFNKEKNEVEIVGFAINEEMLAQQIKLYENLPTVEEIYLKNIQVEKEGYIKFALSFKVLPKYLTSQ